MAKGKDLEIRQAALIYTSIAEKKSGETEAARTARIFKSYERLDKFSDEVKQKGRKLAYETTGATGGGPKIERVGRRSDLVSKGEVAANVLFIKVTICGSGYDKWITEQARNDGGWAELGCKAVAYGRDRSDEGKGWELMLAGTGSAGTKTIKGGALDAGTNTIADLYTDAVNLVGDIVKFHGKDDQDNERPLHIFVRAHSRGSVAGGQVATALKAALGDDTKIEIVDFDPVPGPEFLSNSKRKKGDANYTEMDLGSIDESTVIYCVASGYAKKNISDGFFTPQKILGAKRVIVSKQNHSAGLLNGFVYDGKRYKGSAMNSLPEGVYVDTNDPGNSKIPMELVMGRDEFNAFVQQYPGFETKLKDIDRDRASTRVRQVAKDSGRTPDKERLEIIDQILNEFYSRK